MRAQRFAEESSAAVEPTYSFRLRHLLALLLIGGCLSWIWPRANATLALHNRSAALADYALCMAGPTGVELVKSDPDQFLELVRRRIVSAMPNERPLERCVPLAEKLEVDHATLRLHHLNASSILEYQNDPRGRTSGSLQRYRLPLQEMVELGQAAWPFLRSGYTQLMQPSSHAKEATHPTRPPRFGWGSGLPSGHTLYRSTAAYGDTWVAALGSGANRSILVSTNGGVDWSPGGHGLASDLLDRCIVDNEGRGFTLSRLNEGERIVVSQGPGAPPQVAVLADKYMKIAGISCDESALVAALVGEEQNGLRQIQIRICPFRRPCHDVALPDLGGAPLFYPADIARVAGDIILSRVVGGITRVASTRDEGRTWTPWVVVYDASVAGQAGAAPFKLLTVGDAVLLYGTARESTRYPILLSTDHGASFHAPRVRDREAQPQKLADRD